MFDTILIANRGEIACRIIATCRKMGIRTVAVYSDADAHSLHARVADTAVRIGPAPSRESYLNIAHILDAARRAGAQAIHPGYGFLSENAEFAEACTHAGIVFIGPPAAAIRAMGSKAAAKELMRNAGVPLTPGYDGTNQDPEFLQQQADAIGYPVMIKANAGGGGKGMRRVDARDEFAASLASCKREALASFGDDSVLLEKYLVEPRHVEVQVFGDTHGNVISLSERDCSVQRRHQKVIEEAPAPNLSDDLRRRLGEAGRSAAKAVDYVSAGTVEFLVDRDGGFHFMEMNTRLQVEHPVTEMITGLDLVEWQIRVAAGEPLPLTQKQATTRGHAIEARIYAEDPAHDFRPSIGRIIHLRAPMASENVRVDTGIKKRDAITPFYDPMIAKLIVWDESREMAVRRMVQSLEEFEIVGVGNNVEFLRRLVTSRSFTELHLDTSLIEREHEWLVKEEAIPESALLIAAMSVIEPHAVNENSDSSPWAARDGWRMNGVRERAIRLKLGDTAREVAIRYRGEGQFRMRMDERRFEVSYGSRNDNEVQVVIDGKRIGARVIAAGTAYHVFVDGRHYEFGYDDPLNIETQHHAGEGSLLAPMPGRVVALTAEPGQRVQMGASLLVLEAMKMECTIHAPAAGRVESFNFAAGDQVDEGVELLQFIRDDENGKANG
ncbi:acetyl/propionyl/methylcrotonyl-CoA carboxylase subunit alpha [Occallatibacter riparius]|uniref:Acetyl/propionyl/methylcrotonyl-CoA carboxylase subunit alpha n=1 Tax=Occallatibacter riparius TaxID=1002689 RepID=A0A9J7BQQ4_9BACT|nr:acetyl/propionyl/methylcrotonyl-CoA carboxylase subunit alpha [Occallatibacter riparius]UWZ84911.1 acetyl/propionyl/methylcrotonyl-CoA carboxylase subunit alpha [Occallatibacter riparius]